MFYNKQSICLDDVGVDEGTKISWAKKDWRSYCNDLSLPSPEHAHFPPQI